MSDEPKGYDTLRYTTVGQDSVGQAGSGFTLQLARAQYDRRVTSHPFFYVGVYLVQCNSFSIYSDAGIPLFLSFYSEPPAYALQCY